MAYSIFRPLTDAEKTDMIPLGERDILNLFLKKLTVVKLKFQKKYRPFDSYSARMDFEEKLRIRMENLRTVVDKDKRDMTLDFGDFEQYGDSDRFEYVKDDIVMEDKLLDGIRTPYKIGKRFKFKGKTKGNRISILIPISVDGTDRNFIKEMEDWISITYLKKDKKKKVEDLEPVVDTDNDLNEVKE